MSGVSIKGVAQNEIDRAYLKKGLRRIAASSPRKEAPPMLKPAFLAAVDECMKTGAFDDRTQAMKWLVGRALLYFEKFDTNGSRQHAVKPSSFFENGKYKEDSAELWNPSSFKFTSKVRKEDEERVWQLAASIQRNDSQPLDEDGTVAERLDASTMPAEYADDTLALRFTAEHGSDLRYTAGWGQWSVWTGSVWRRDDTLRVFDLVRKTCRQASEECGDNRIVQRIASAQTVSAVERLARADRRHAAMVEQWDADLWLLNTPGGVIDLRTGEMRRARREDYMTKTTTVAPGGDCPTWLTFLKKITAGDRELQGFLQRMAGYALTGVIREHALFFIYGTGANGKSVFLDAICGTLGDYARTAPIGIFVVSKNQAHPTERAGLQGARLVTAVETEDGRCWAESTLKMLTGGDRVAARYMRQDFFEYIPQFKLVIAGNHKPGLRTVDEAIRRRLHLIPFSVTIPKPERDLELSEKLRAERPGILQWAIEGCLAWQTEGLKPPAVVAAATEDYFAAEDALARFLEDCVERKDGAWLSATELYNCWKEWTRMAGEIEGSQKQFCENLITRGFESRRKNTGRGFNGIMLKPKTVTDGDALAIYTRHTRARNGHNRQTRHNPSLPNAEDLQNREKVAECDLDSFACENTLDFNNNGLKDGQSTSSVDTSQTVTTSRNDVQDDSLSIFTRQRPVNRHSGFGFGRSPRRLI